MSNKDMFICYVMGFLYNFEENVIDGNHENVYINVMCPRVSHKYMSGPGGRVWYGQFLSECTQPEVKFCQKKWSKSELYDFCTGFNLGVHCIFFLSPTISHQGIVTQRRKHIHPHSFSSCFYLGSNASSTHNISS